MKQKLLQITEAVLTEMEYTVVSGGTERAYIMGMRRSPFSYGNGI